MSEQDITEQDRALLSTVDQVLANEGNTAADGGEGSSGTEAGSFYQFCAQLAGTVPQAGEEFREQLLARLMARAEEQALTAQPTANGHRQNEQTVAPGRAPGGPPARSRRVEPARFLGHIRSVAQAAGAPRARRFASTLAGVAGAALMVAFLLGMAAVIKLRTDATHASRTATAVAMSGPSSRTPASTVVVSADTSGRVLALEPLRTIETGPMMGIEWSPDGRTLATWSNSTIAFWDAVDGKLLRNMQVRNITGMAWSPDGGSLAANVAGGVVLVDLTTGQRRQVLTTSFPGSVTSPQSLAWSPDGRTLAIGLFPRGLDLWDLASGKITHTLDNLAEKLAWSPDGRALAVGMRGFVTLVDPVSGQSLVSLPASMLGGPSPIPTTAPDLLPSSDLKTPGSPTATIDPFGGWQYDPRFDYYGSSSTPAWSPDGRILVSHHSFTIRFWDPTAGKQLRTITVRSTSGLRKVAWSPDGRVLASLDSRLRFWDPITDGEIPAAWKGADPGDNVLDFEWSPAGPTLAVREHDSTNVTLWGVSTAASPIATDTPLPAAATDTTVPQPTPAYLTPTPVPDCGLIWRTVTGPGLGPLNGVAAVSPNDVWAVGSSGDASKTLTVHWDGTAWSVVPSPNVGSTDNVLYAVAAISKDDVWAVGRYDDDRTLRKSKTLTLHWNGREWKVVPSPDVNSGANELRSLAAISVRDVWAVGTYTVCGDSPCTGRTLVLHWDGAQWNRVSTPNAANDSNYLRGVAAVSANDVWAVGYHERGPGDPARKALIMHWDGKAWGLAPGLNLGSDPGAGSAVLYAVAAVSRDNVWAVGGSGSMQPEGQNLLILHWDGKTWTDVSHDGPTGGNATVGLYGIASLAANDIWAVGSFYGRVVMRWDGKAWRPVNVPGLNEAYGPSSSLYGITALSPSQAWSVGGMPGAAGSGVNSGFAMRHGNVPCVPGTQPPRPTMTPMPTWTPSPTETVTPTPTGTSTPTWPPGKPTPRPVCGTWKAVPGPDLGGNVSLRHMAVVSENDIWAVGSARGESLVVHWDGKAWARVASPDPPNSTNIELYSVSAASKDDIWAVGRYTGPLDDDESLTLTMHWDGRSWAIVPSPSFRIDNNDHYNYLNGVAAISKNDAWAVGSYSRDGHIAGSTLVLHWDGKVWTQVPSPNVADAKNALYGIAALSANDIWAVGSAGWIAGLNNTRTLAAHWDGKAWTQVPSPGDGTPYDVVALSRSNIWAAGPGIIVHWDGVQWRSVPGPDLTAGDPNLYSIANVYGIAARSANDVWTVGNWFVVGSGNGIVVGHWDGTQWSRAPSPDDKPGFRYPFGAIAVTGSSIWVAGSAGPDSHVLLSRFVPGPCSSP